MGKVISKMQDLDVFGEPVSVKYKGANTFKTLPGALLSLLLFGFIFTFALLSFLDLIAYRNPIVSQVSISDLV